MESLQFLGRNEKNKLFLHISGGESPYNFFIESPNDVSLSVNGIKSKCETNWKDLKSFNCIIDLSHFGINENCYRFYVTDSSGDRITFIKGNWDDHKMLFDLENLINLNEKRSETLKKILE